MQCRQVNFFIELEDLTELLGTIESRVLPDFEELPHFLRLTAIKADYGPRCEVIVATYWDDGLEGSEEQSDRFIAEIVRETGRNPSRKAFDTLYAQVRNAAGDFRLGRDGWGGRRRDFPSEALYGDADQTSSHSEIGGGGASSSESGR